MSRCSSLVGLLSVAVVSACGDPEPQFDSRTVTAGQTCGFWRESDEIEVAADCDKYSSCSRIMDTGFGHLGVCVDDAGSCGSGYPSRMPRCYVHERVAETEELICTDWTSAWGSAFCLQPCASHADCVEPYQVCVDDGFRPGCFVIGCQKDPTRCPEGTTCGPDSVCIPR